jgi:hypothetical protein
MSDHLTLNARLIKKSEQDGKMMRIGYAGFGKKYSAVY